jgi:hypothetical protein
MGKQPTISRVQLEKIKASLLAEAEKKLGEGKKRRALVSRAVAIATRQQQAREAALKKRADNHAKIVLGVAVINLAQHDSDLRAKIEAHARQFYALSPGRLEATLKALALTVTKPESEAWEENT